MAETNPNDDFAAKSEAFLSWLQQNGTTITPKIQLADLRFRQAGRGVLAKEDIAEDEELFSIPRSTILTTETSKLPDEVKNKFDDQWLSLITAMIYEHQRGAESTWKPYFDVLPSTFSTLMFWKESSLKYLEGSAVLDKIGKKSAEETFTTKVLPILKQHAELFNLSNATDDDLLALCHRMGSTIMAYAFDLERPQNEDSNAGEEDWEDDREDTETLPKGMVPLADMLNADADRNNAKLYYEDDKVVMKSIKSIKAGEEIFNDYGPLPQADMLRRYGYTTKNYEQYDVVEIPRILIEQRAQEQQKLQSRDLIERTSYLEEQGALEDAYDIAHAHNPESDQFPEELCILLNTLTLPKPDFDKLKKKDKLPKPTLTPESLRLLYTILVHRRADYKFDTFMEEHKSLQQTTTSAIFSGGDADTAEYRQMDAQFVIRGEKSVLEEAAEKVQEMLHGAEGEGKRLKRRANTFEEEAKERRAKQGKPLTEEAALKHRSGLGSAQHGRRTDLEAKGKKTKYSGT